MMKYVSSLFINLIFLSVYAQQVRQYDLVRQFQEHKLQNFSKQVKRVLKEPGKKAISASGITWLEGADFKEGIIEVDLRGRNISQQSFLGIAFNGIDTSHYEAVYFRPFNFGSPDTLRQKHTVQYISMPDNPWYKLRKEHPLLYENKADPMPGPENWFHATIIVRADTVDVDINYSNKPSLKVRRLGIQPGYKIALWSDGLPGYFSNLVIKPLN